MEKHDSLWDVCSVLGHLYQVTPDAIIEELPDGARTVADGSPAFREALNRALNIALARSEYSRVANEW